MADLETKYANSTFDCKFKYLTHLRKHPKILQEFLELVLTCFTSIQPNSLSTPLKFAKLKPLTNRVTRKWTGYLPSCQVTFTVRFHQKVIILIKVQRNNVVNNENTNRPHDDSLEPPIYVVFHPAIPFRQLKPFDLSPAKELNPICFHATFISTVDHICQTVQNLRSKHIYINYKNDLNGPLEGNFTVLNNWIKIFFCPDKAFSKVELLSENQQKFLNTIKSIQEAMPNKPTDKVILEGPELIAKDERLYWVIYIVKTLFKELYNKENHQNWNIDAFIKCIKRAIEWYPQLYSKNVRKQVAIAVLEEFEDFQPNFSHPLFEDDSYLS